MLVLATAAGGCAESGGTGSPAMPLVTGDGPPVWPFWPMRMRLHPLSRLVTNPETGETVIEVRIELFDDTGDTVKGIGLVRINLHEIPLPEGGGSVSEMPVATWNRDLRDLELNELHFDDVTRTYLFRLEVDEAQLPPAAELRGYFASTDGRLLQADLVLRME